MSSQGQDKQLDNMDLDAYFAQSENENELFYEDASARNNSDDGDILPTDTIKPVFPTAARLLSKDDQEMQVLFEDIVLSVDNNNAAAYTKAENPKNGVACSNGWYRVFRDMFNPINGKARKFRTTESSDRVSNFKGKIVNQIWPEFEKTIQNKSDMELSPLEKMCKEQIRRYNKNIQQAKLKKQAKGVLQDNMGRIETSMGAAPARNGTGPNTSLVLEPVPGSRSQVQGSMVPPATPQVGLGGYPTMPGTAASSSPFDALTTQLIASIGSLFGGGTGNNANESSIVTPAGPPPSKRPKVLKFQFIRKDSNNGTRYRYSTDVSNLDPSETLKSLKSRCAKKAGDKVFKFPRGVQEDLKQAFDAGTKLLQVTVAGEFTVEYNELKSSTIGSIMDLLSDEGSRGNPITLEFAIVDVGNGNSSGSDGMDYAMLDSE